MNDKNTFGAQELPKLFRERGKMTIYVMGDNNTEKQKTNKEVSEGLVIAINGRRE